MLLHVFSVYDSKVGAFMSPFFMRSKGEAIRSFESVVNDPTHAFNKHPGDYTLFFHGHFDECGGLFFLEASPLSLGLGLEYIKGNTFVSSNDDFRLTPPPLEGGANSS